MIEQKQDTALQQERDRFLRYFRGEEQRDGTPRALPKDSGNVLDVSDVIVLLRGQKGHDPLGDFVTGTAFEMADGKRAFAAGPRMFP
nr:hypothetical protein [Brevibacillus agri]